jgi:2-keto-4-pentenoate hydratase
MSDENRAGGAADVLWTAWISGERIAALPDEVRPRDDAEGFAAQLAIGGHAGRSYGWKIAATTTSGQAHIGVRGPLPGPLFERFRHDPGDVLASDDMHMRVVERTPAYLGVARVGAAMVPILQVGGLKAELAALANDPGRAAIRSRPRVR